MSSLCSVLMLAIICQLVTLQRIWTHHEHRRSHNANWYDYYAVVIVEGRHSVAERNSVKEKTSVKICLFFTREHGVTIRDSIPVRAL